MLLLGAAETVVGISNAFRPHPDRRGLYLLNQEKPVQGLGGVVPQRLRVVAAR